MSVPPMITLSDGNVMPQLGLGVWRASNEQAANAVAEALAAGYRAIDTAAIYRNEVGVGQALQATSVPRSEIFVTTKLWNADHLAPEQALQDSLNRLQLEYIDLYLIHWPLPERDHYVEAWQGLLRLKEQGLAKSVGVCNFKPHHLQRLLDETGVLPVVNQIELHPLFQQHDVAQWNAARHIRTESWSPLAQGGDGVFDHPVIQQLARKYAKSPAQIVIRWHLDRGLIVIPKSVTPSRIRENIDVFDFKLEQEDIDAIATLDSGKRLGQDPDLPRSDTHKKI
ncbi:2,5-didehydrogluconate reductase DkgA [Musicola paradisiaca]|uniref:2,5-didehydrogluconate reductase n=1 Tax=Musicola paradisiaca (strain Ech703) TaxID=579405 RepID=C6C435_MUSP7|nr:2,5-didehydrogluconate reductase DkgA [Musicola paradisiaca]ACS87362.1 2,5-didehydrogluconate reductase [Musicola paradisiaca Ech703]